MARKRADRFVTLLVSGDMKNTAVAHLVRQLNIIDPLPYNIGDDVIEIGSVSEQQFEDIMVGPAPIVGPYDSFDTWLTAQSTKIEVRVQK
jgi:hypothetical protein